MISIILYGRNDSYGYNLHKRAALSLNCMSEVLTDPEDEILFVDYNTPDDYPTFPEAIEDTLTEKAKKLLRIFRVRPTIHARYAGKTHLKALEAISRNIAARRSNPANRWILSTNTDMIFVPQKGHSLTEIVRELDDGYWAVPRFEIPESLWESFDRKDPVSVIRTVAYWGRRAHLNEIVLGCDENLFDAPGDFQLMPRKALIEINGFDERMLLGWHVDSNIAKRLNLLYGKTSDLRNEVYGYHCDHTRQVTPAHRHRSVENDMGLFFENITNPLLSSQEAWGSPDDHIEEVSLTKNSASLLYRAALEESIKSIQEKPSVSLYRPEGYDKVDYDPDHVLAFLADLFVNEPRDINVFWIGFRKETLRIFSNVWISLEFSRKIIIDRDFCRFLNNENDLDLCVLEKSEALAKAEVFVVDFGILESSSSNEENEIPPKYTSEKSRCLTKMFFSILDSEHGRIRRGENIRRRVVTINAFFNRFEKLVRDFVGVARTPFSTRIQQGFILPPFEEENLLPRMFVGSSGKREQDGTIRILPLEGLGFYGPYLTLSSGVYRLEGKAEFKGEYVFDELLEVALCYSTERQESVISQHLFPGEGNSSEFSLTFDVPGGVADSSGSLPTYEFRLWTKGRSSIIFLSLILKRIRDVSQTPSFIGEELLTKLSVGSSGKRKGNSISGGTEAGFVSFGPYLPLSPGCYSLSFLVEVESVNFLTDLKDILMRRKNGSYLDVVVVRSADLQERIAFMSLSVKKGKIRSYSLDFDVHEDNLFEFRLWSDGKCFVNLKSMKLLHCPHPI